ncbi:MAG: SPOR domain-containing protein, partial [Bacteroidales bacterium]|nr:SPOR domain-containing protein [Bacteroidales bacterium]
TKAKPETAAKAETGPVTKAKPETAAKAETRTGSGSGPKKESEASPETRTHGRSGIDHRSGQRDYAVSSLSSQSARTALHTETAKTPPSRKSRKVGYTNQLLIWIVIILFVNIIILAWFLYRDDIRQIFKKGQETVLVSDTLDIAEPVSSAFEMTEDVSEPVVEEVPAIEEAAPMEVPVTADAQTLAGQPRFYIVAGCFSEEVNADALVRSLRTKGFNAEKFGRIGNLHAVSYTSFNNRADALRELERIRKEEQPDAWMTRF